MADEAVVSNMKAKFETEGADKAASDMDKLHSKTNDTASGFTKALGAVTGFITGFAGFQLAGDAIDFLKDHMAEWVKGAQDAEVLQADTNRILQSGAHVIGLTSDQVDGLATSYMNLTGVDDDLIHGAENILANFGSISSKTFPDATKEAINMAIAMQMAHGGALDMTGAAQALGRALENPATGARLLRQYNIILSDSQQKQIRDFMAVNNVAGAQAVIMDAVKDKVGGAADAFGATNEGKIMRFQTALGNMGKTIGGIVVPLFSDLMDIVNPVVQGFANFLPGAIDQASKAIGTVTGYLSPLAGVLQQAWQAVQDLGSLFQTTFSQGLKGVGGDLKGMLPDMRDVAFQLGEFVIHVEDAAKGPVINLAKGLANLVQNGFKLVKDIMASDLMTNMRNMSENMRNMMLPAIQGVGTWIQNSLLPALRDVGPKFADLGKTLATDVLPAVLTVYVGIQSLVPWLEVHLLPILEAIIPPLIQFAGVLAQGVSTAIKNAGPIIQQLGDGLGHAKDMFTSLQGPLSAVGNFIATIVVPAWKNLVQAFKDAMPHVLQFRQEVQDRLIPIFNNVKQAIQDALPHIQQLISDISTRLTPIIKNATDALKQMQPVFKAIGDWIASQLAPKVKDFAAFWNAVWPGMQEVLGEVWGAIKGIVEIAWNILSGIVKIGLDILGGNWKGAWKDMQNMLAGVWHGIQDTGQALFGHFRDWIVGKVNEIKTNMVTAFNNAKQGVLDALTNLKDNALSTLESLPGKFADLGKKIVQSLADAIRNGVGTIAQALKDLIHNSMSNLPGGFSIPGFASGTDSAPGGLARVGEGRTAELVIGPHLMNLPRGSGVVPVEISSNSQSSGGTTQYFSEGAIVINGANMSADEIYDAWQERAAWLARGRGHG